MAADAEPEPAALDRSWTLVSGHGPAGPVSAVAGHPITLVIEGDRWAGSAGCNRYTTAVARDGGRVTIPHGIATTLMACPDDVMVAELAYLGALPSVRTFELVGDRLTLRGAGVDLVFQLTAVAFEPTSADQEDLPLVGTDWAVVALDDGSTGMSTGVVGAPSLRFAEGGDIAGTTGCNRFLGRYELAGATTLAIGPLATTRMACDGAAEAQEAALLRVLSDASVEASIAGASLHLSRAAVGAVICTAAPAGVERRT